MDNGATWVHGLAASRQTISERAQKQNLTFQRLGSTKLGGRTYSFSGFSLVTLASFGLKGSHKRVVPIVPPGHLLYLGMLFWDGWPRETPNHQFGRVLTRKIHVELCAVRFASKKPVQSMFQGLFVYPYARDFGAALHTLVHVPCVCTILAGASVGRSTTLTWTL